MKTLRQVIDEASDQQRGLMAIRIHEHFGGLVSGIPMTITAILDNTAVMHPLGRPQPENRKVVNLNDVFVEDSWIEWVDKSYEEMRLFRGRHRAHFNIKGDTDFRF